MKKFVVSIVVGMVLFVPGAARAQFEESAANLVQLAQNQLGNLGYTRYRGFGARALGMGGAYIALADDLTAASWNPAGLAQILRPSVSAGLAYSSTDVDQRFAFNGDWAWSSSRYSQTMAPDSPFSFSGTDSETHLDYLAASYPFFLSKDWGLSVSATYFRSLVFDQDYSAGADLGGHPIDVFFNRLSDPNGNPFDPGNFAQRGEFQIDSYEARQHRSGYLDAYSASAAFAYKQRFFVGLTLSYWDGSLTGKDQYRQGGQLIENFGEDSQRQIALSALSTQYIDLNSMSGWSVALGGLIKVTPEFRFGIVYKPGYTLNVDGRISRNVDVNKGDKTDSFLRDFRFNDSDVDYPDSLGLGVAWIKKRWTVALDWNHTSWEGTSLEGMEMASAGNDGGPVTFSFPSLSLLRSKLGNSSGYEQFDSTVWRVGAEYVLDVKGVDVPVRFGAFKENAYRNVPGEGDGLDITGLTAGLGVLWRHWRIDMAMVYEDMDQGFGGSQFSEPRFGESGPVPTVAQYRFLNGSDLSQSSLRVLANIAYLF